MTNETPRPTHLAGVFISTTLQKIVIGSDETTAGCNFLHKRGEVVRRVCSSLSTPSQIVVRVVDKQTALDETDRDRSRARGYR